MHELFRVATFNANSLRVRLGIIADWLATHRPDALCVQETKVQDHDFPVDAFHTNGYHVAFRGQKSHAGVAVACRAKPEDIAFGLDDGDPPDEARLIRLTVSGVTIVNTYVPMGEKADSPKFTYKLEWLRRLRRYFERHFSPHEPLLWCGDFNVAPQKIDVHDPVRLKSHVDFHPESRAALEEVRAWGFVDVFRRHHPEEPEQYTFWDYRVRGALERGIGWRVDHIWATTPLAEHSVGSWIDVAPRRLEKPSDHTFLVADFRKGAHPQP